MEKQKAISCPWCGFTDTEENSDSLMDGEFEARLQCGQCDMTFLVDKVTEVSYVTSKSPCEHRGVHRWNVKYIKVPHRDNGKCPDWSDHEIAHKYLKLVRWEQCEDCLEMKVTDVEIANDECISGLVGNKVQI